MLFVCVILFPFLCSLAEGYLENDVYNASQKNFIQQVWHSYMFDSGVGNREELNILKVASDTNNGLPIDVFKWKSFQVQGETIIVGLGSNFILATPFNNKNNVESYREEVKGTPKSLCLFQKWEPKVQSIQSYVVIVVTTEEKTDVLKWYTLHNKQLKFLEDWSFHQTITHLEVVKINHEFKLILAGQEKDNIDFSISIYNFNIIPRLDTWLFEKIHLKEIPSSFNIFGDHDNTFLAISHQQVGVVDIWRYSKILCMKSGEKHFNHHQRIFAKNAKSVVSFRVGFIWSIAVASQNSRLYQMDDNLLLNPVKYFNLGDQDEWMVVPVNTYREDVILLSKSTDGISALIWNGNEIHQLIHNFTGLVCMNDLNCYNIMNEADLKNSVTFPLNNHQNILISSKERVPLLVKLLVKLRPLPDEISATLNELIKLKNELENSYKLQSKEIETLKAINDSIANESPETEVSNTTRNDTEIRKNKKLNIGSQTKNWSDTLVALDILKSRLNDVKNTFDNFTEETLNAGLSSNQNESSSERDILPEFISDGIVFDGKIIINNLNISTLNGYDMKDLLENSYRKDRIRKVGGRKTFDSVNVEELIFEKVNDIMGCDMIFSDDPWEGFNNNVINGDVLWESKLNILNDFVLMPGDKKDHVSSTKNYETFSNIPKHMFDELYFEDLEIRSESVVLKSINSRPMILPVHPAPVDIHYLDTVSQARIEVVNVLGNLTVDQLNGKNLTELMERINSTSYGQPMSYDSLKIDGVLRVESLEPEYLNSMPIKPGDGKEKSRSSFDSSPSGSQSERESKLENLEIPSQKRNIYVFQNLEIDGKLLTRSLNNLELHRLKKTVRKGESTIIKGVKTFIKPLKFSRLDVTTINDENLAENIMTNTTEQTIEFPQKFESVIFENLNLNGTWDNIDVNKINESITSPRMNFGGNLTAENSALMVQNLIVTDAVNDVQLNDLGSSVKKNLSIDSGNGLKHIKAFKVTVGGSLDSNNNVNNVNLTDLDNTRVSIKREQIVEKDINQQDLNIDGHLSVTELNGNDVTSVLNSVGDLIVIDRILQKKIKGVKNLLVKGNIDTENGINSHNLSELFESGVYLGAGSYIQGNITFEDTVNFKDLNVTNTINGISLKKLEEDVVLRHYHVFLNGTKSFPSLNVLKDVKAKSLNGHLIQDVVTLMGDHAMKGSLKINGNVVVKANMTATGSLNDVPVSQLLKTFSTELDSYISVDDLYLKGEKVIIKNLLAHSLIQNVSFDNLMKNAVFKNDCCNVTGRKSFTGSVKFKKNLFVENTIDELNLKELAENIVLVNEPGKINGTLRISEAILNSLYVSDSFNSNLVNDFDLNDWFEESISLDGQEIINGKMKFEKPIIEDNIDVDLINGHMSSAVITIKGKQFIPVLGLFQRLNVTSDVAVSGNVNGYNLPNEYESSVLLSEKQTINSKMIFHNDFVIHGNLYVDEINGKSMADLITLDTEQIINNNLNFLGTVTINGNIDNLKFINGINLKDWYQRSVFLNRPQEIYGFWEARGNLKAKSIGGNATLNDVYLRNVSKQVHRDKLMAIQKKEETEIEYYANCHELEELSRDLNKLPYLFQQFDIAHVIETQSIVESIVPLKIGDLNYLIISFFDECYSAMYIWDEKNSAFDYLRHVNIGPITKWLVTYYNNSTYLVTSSFHSNLHCEENRLPGNIWVFNVDSSKYIHLLTGNAFVDMVQANETAKSFFTLEENGHIYQWTIQNDNIIEDVFLVNVGLGTYRFIDFKIFGGLAISNGREIREIKLVDKKIVLNYFSLHYGNIVALPVNGKVLVGVVLKDKIIVYENIKEEKVFCVIQTYRPGSILWLNYGLNRQSFLIVSSHHKFIEIFEYESVSGFIRRMSLQLFSVKLQAISLPLFGKHQLGKFVVVVQKSKVIFLKADMLGDLYDGNDSFC